VSNREPKYLLGKSNITLVLVGVALMVVGYLLMIGGGSEDPNIYNEDELYGFRRTGLAPILIIAGLVTQIFAIMRPNSGSSDDLKD